ncbi:metalloregulator ArsR/SmtB family transcription factor [Maritalea porphyrae]|uniref:metalloregulator ArsR/SmtB family transcription factor n=1 Tax=Maritalea porphyrae TaxID=880732 RepID=UPI0022AFB61B|nr:metalloregulator ArsR/SmtB family transcription factor [Maritalea porphyrae]MCZ4272565.1 metalloregulator ArsR/SmtB family transcription factor [Maritalea porphyrae]
MAELREFVDILRAAGEITRLRLLSLLAAGELSVKDLTEILDQSQPRVSRHLRLLTESGLVSRHAEGAWAFFRLSDEANAAVLVQHLLEQLDASDPVLQADVLRLEAVRRDHQMRAATYFSKVARDWDRVRSLHAPESAVEAAIVDMMKGTSVEMFIDLGTGTGRMLELLDGHFKKGVGIDSSREMISVARSKFERSGQKSVFVRLGDIAQLDEYSASADITMLHQVLHHFLDPGKALLNARQTLKPGGKIVVVDFMPHKLEFLREEQAHKRLGLSHEQMQAWAQAAHLKVTDAREIPHNKPGGGLTVCIWHLTDQS